MQYVVKLKEEFAVQHACNFVSQRKVANRWKESEEFEPGNAAHDASYRLGHALTSWNSSSGVSMTTEQSAMMKLHLS
jgi:hypothetical protein